MLGAVLLIAIIVVVVLELVGVSRSERNETDTITEWYRKFRDNLKQPWRGALMIAMTAFLIWVIFHFLDLA